MSNVGNEVEVATENPEVEDEDEEEEDDDEDDDEWLAEQDEIALQVLFRPRLTSEDILDLDCGAVLQARPHL